MRTARAVFAAVFTLLMAAVALEVVADECARLEADLAPPLRRARWNNQPHNVSFYWDSAPSRVTAAVLVVLLRYWLGYRDVYLRQAPFDYCDLNSTDNRVAVGVWTARRRHCEQQSKWPLVGESTVQVRLRLHARLASNASQYCATAVRNWSFYQDKARLRNCSFLGTDLETHAVLYTLCNECKETVTKFKERAGAMSLLIGEPEQRTRPMRAENRSFLFIDYDIWQDDPHVKNVQSPPCLPDDTPCSDQGVLDNTIGVTFFKKNLQYSAPPLANVVRKVMPESKHLRELLDLEAVYTNRSVEETACSWARNHSKEFTLWAEHGQPIYIIMLISCKSDTEIDNAYFDIIIENIKMELRSITKEFGFSIDIKWFSIDCYNKSQFSDAIIEKSKFVSWYNVLGLVARGEGAIEVARGSRMMHLDGHDMLPMVLYDAAPAPARELRRGPVWAVAGTAPQLARALRRLLAACGWRRLAVLSDATYLARALADALDTGGLLLQRTSLSLEMTNETLHYLKSKNAKIFLVNTGPKEAAEVLTAAFRLQMTPANGYAWIVREWSGHSVDERNATREMKDMMRFYTISLWSRNRKDIFSRTSSTYRSQLVSALGEEENATWTLRAAPLADALLTLGYGFTAFFRNHSQYSYDIHSADAVGLIAKSLNEKGSIKGFSVEELQFDETENRTVYIDEWSGNIRTRLAVWLVSGDRVFGEGFKVQDLPSDGYRSCIAQYGDPFEPNCLDGVWMSALVLLPLLSIGLWAARERQRKQEARRNEELELARLGNNVTKLLSLVVNRDELEIREELGFGKSGRVNLAILRSSGHPRAVAAKALRDGAALTEESEFLREACTLASLKHDHVVRLVGVCVVGGPTLVLMEHAFFGDLLRYLRARRHLAEGIGGHPDAPDPEAEHVSPEALTRLAREAASALGYLALRGVVHCDLRAANCLVDARRSLKLGDFGMARQTQSARADAGMAEYACRRRAMFPVLWMAPESLTRGVFSAASDVWSLGVLVFELVTLGARPYGDWSPMRVLHYVHDGGRPSLPLDASPQTRGLTRACWRRAGEERPSAAAVVAYLAERPRALCPALLHDPSGPALHPMDTDSGFGEAPPSPSPDAGLDDLSLALAAPPRSPSLTTDHAPEELEHAECTASY